jgi:two-component system chemotaxis response regulator CheB
VTATTNPREVATTFRAVQAGAVAVLPIPAGIGHPEHESTASELIQTVKLMAEVKVVKRWPRSRNGQPPAKIEIETIHKKERIEVVAIGASTGGPPVLQTILSSLPTNFPAPLLIVQHIASGFVDGFVQWLKAASGISVQVARNGETMLPGRAYVAPDNFHMVVTSQHTIALRGDPPENGLRPSVATLFRSVARVYGQRAAGVLLTGMGKDGADELRQIKDAGGITFAQNEETCVVYGMPGEAVKLDAATYILPPQTIASSLTTLMNK